MIRSVFQLEYSIMSCGVEKLPCSPHAECVTRNVPIIKPPNSLLSSLTSQQSDAPSQPGMGGVAKMNVTRCECVEGFEGDGITCSDVDECSAYEYNKRVPIYDNKKDITPENTMGADFICPQNSHCINLPGSYRCECFSGYSLSNDNFTCIGKMSIFNTFALFKLLGLHVG